MPFKLSERLEHLAKNPAMYVHPLTFGTIRSYLCGLRHGLGYAGIDYSSDEYQSVALSRGFDARGSTGIVADFVSKGLREDQMIQELIAIEASVYASVLGRINKQV